MNENIESIKPTKIMMRMIMVSALILIVVGIIYYRSLAALPFALGVMATSGFNLLKLRMLEKTVQKVINMEDQEAGKNLVRIQYLLRYFLTAIVLVAIGLISNYTTAPPFYSERATHFAVWAAIFPNGPESLLSAPLISVWGALAGLFTLNISGMLIKFFKLEKDGTEFIKYDDEDDADAGSDGDDTDLESDENDA